MHGSLSESKSFNSTKALHETYKESKNAISYLVRKPVHFLKSFFLPTSREAKTRTVGTLEEPGWRSGWERAETGLPWPTYRCEKIRQSMVDGSDNKTRNCLLSQHTKYRREPPSCTRSPHAQ